MDVPGISNLAILRHNRGIKIPAFCVPDLPISNFFDDIFFSFLNSALILFPLSLSLSSHLKLVNLEFNTIYYNFDLFFVE